MSTKRRITRAWCVELNETVTIAGARRAYFSQPEPRSRFLFHCSSPECRALKPKPKITAVNYDVHPSEDSRVQTPHFKGNNKYFHHPDCEWEVEDDDDTTLRNGETESEHKVRLAKRKLKALIDVFDPQSEPDDGVPRAGTEGRTPAVSAPSRAPSHGGEPGTRSDKKIHTKDLRRLVDAYTEAKETLDEEVFKELKIEIKGQGVMPLRSYFLPSRYAKAGKGGHVYWGRGYLLPRKGESFVFRFFDKNGDNTSYVKVSAATMNAYRSKGYVNDLLSKSESIKHFTFYFLGEFTYDEERKAMNANIDDLRKLVIDLGPEKPKAEPNVI